MLKLSVDCLYCYFLLSSHRNVIILKRRVILVYADRFFTCLECVGIVSLNGCLTSHWNGCRFSDRQVLSKYPAHPQVLTYLFPIRKANGSRIFLGHSWIHCLCLCCENGDSSNLPSNLSWTESDAVVTLQAGNCW